MSTDDNPAGTLADQRQQLFDQLLDAAGVGRLDSTVPRLKDDTEPSPSFAQERLWFLDRLQPGRVEYSMPAAFEIRGALDAGALRRALNELVARHQPLRATYTMAAGRPVQHIARDRTIDLPIVDLRPSPDPASDAGGAGDDRSTDPVRRAVERQIQDEAGTPFDLESGPLLRAMLLRTGEADHVLIVNIHHIACDGWSLHVLFRELDEAYTAFAEGNEHQLPPLPVQYGDFAAWQRAELAGPEGAASIAWWLSHLDGAPRTLDLATDFARPPVRSGRGSRRAITVPAYTMDRLRDVARQCGATTFMTLLTAFAVLLRRYGAGQDFLVGCPVGNRTRTAFEPLIGNFVNTLPLRFDLNGEPTFRDLVIRVREEMLAALGHAQVPFEVLVERLQDERTLSRTPLVQVACVDQQTQPDAGVRTSGRIRRIDLHNGTAKFDLMLSVEAGAVGAARLVFEYSTDLFGAETIDRWLSYLHDLLGSVARQPDRRLADLLAPAGEERSALDAWSVGASVGVVGGLVHELVGARVRVGPGVVAVECGQRRLSYGQLWVAAGVLARRLVGLGVGPESRVGVLFERSVESVVALLGVLRAGAAYVPLDPQLPDQRLGLQLADAAVRVVVCGPELAGRLPGDVTGVPFTVADHDADHGLPDDPDDAVGLPRVDPDGLGFVFFTSGSTGRPKAVGLAHRGLCNRLLWMQRVYGLTAADRVALKTSVGFDVSLWEFLWPLIAGARVVVVPPGMHREPAALVGLLADRSVTVTHFVPSLLELVAAEPGLARCRSLRLVVASGEVLPAGLAQRLLERLPWARLDNLYGPTEASIDVSAWRAGVPVDGAVSVPIGRPVDNMRLLVLDAGLGLVPVGVAGELFVGGVGLARGYLGRGGLTAERFVPDPFGAVGGRLYRTGDRVRWLPGGVLEFLGRLDAQVKIRGVRVEPGEVEAVLAAHPQVGSCVVAARPGPDGAVRLVAWVQPSSEPAPTPAHLRRWLDSRLPQALIPAGFMTVTQWPLTPSGKIDRKALPDPPVPTSHRDDDTPRTATEQVLTGIWQDVLGIDHISPTDDFFHLGGDSILAIGVVHRAREAGLELTVADLFQHHTIVGLAAAARPLSADTDARRVAPFEGLDERDRLRIIADHGQDVENAYPLSALQAGMLYHQARDEEFPAFHNVNAIQVRADFDRDALELAAARVVARHPVLRTSIALEAYSEPIQLVHRSATLPITVHDLRALTPDEQTAAFDTWTAEQHRRPLPLDIAPLLRLDIHRLTDDTMWLTLTECHAILDGWSFTSTIAELLDEYEAALDGRVAEVPEPLATFHEFVLAEREALTSAETKAYWDETMRRLEPGLLDGLSIVDSQPGAAPVHRRTVELSTPLSARVHAFAQAAGVSTKCALLAAHATVIGMLTGRTDVVTGLVTNGRPETADGDRVRGLFLNTLPVGLTLTGRSWTQRARAASEAESQMQPHRRYPMAALRRDNGGQPLFETTFNFTNFHSLQPRLRPGRVQLASSFVELAYTDIPLVASFNQSPEAMQRQLTLLLIADARRLTAAQVDAVSSLYLRVIEAMTARPDSVPTTTDLMSPGELAWLLASGTGAEVSLPEPLLVHGLIGEQAARRPHAIAVECRDRRLSYGELWAASGDLASRLRTRGAGVETCVAVLLERSVDLVVALVAVLRAGAAYVPLDPELPDARLRAMAADAGARLLITQPHLAGRLAVPADCLVLTGDGDTTVVDGSSEPVDVDPDQLAYVMFTSGSTGRPKGVGVPHRALVNFAHAMRRQPGIGPDDVVVAMAPVGFDIAFMELLAPLTAGARVVVEEVSPATDPDAVAAHVAGVGATLVHATPAKWELLLEAQALTLDGVRVLCGGEALPVPLARRLCERGATVWNPYGPTETTIWSTIHPVGRAVRTGALASVPIGRPLHNAVVRVLDANLDIAPAGAPGELYIGGPGLARGYVGEPGATAERFVPDPAGSGERLYRTGDRVRWLPDRGLLYLGRVDAQVKIRGVRVEPAEVQATLAGHPRVARCAVSARPGPDGHARLIAWVVPAHGGPVTPAGPRASADADELRAWLAARLPAALIPSAFVELDALPLTPNGKVDYRALPDTIPALAPVRTVAPRTEAERLLLAIWADLLGVADLGVEDDFFAHGGDSVLAMRVAARARQAGLPINPRDLFEHPTVASLAAAATGGRPAREPIEDQVEPAYPAGMAATQHAAAMAEIAQAIGERP